jgi:hypothetical protein
MAEPRYAALGYGAPAPTLNGGAVSPGPAAAISRPDVPTFSSAEIPGGDACISELNRAGVAFHRLDDKRGITTPVEVTGKINGIRYQAGAGNSMVADCRLVLALHRVGPVLSELGVVSMRFSGAYSYRMSKVGRLSLHAYGLALDVHEVLFGASWQSVERDFIRSLPDGCAATSPLLNQLSCRLGATRLFKELLTPDYDSDHANHVHLAIAPIDVPKPAEAPKGAQAPKAAQAPRAPQAPKAAQVPEAPQAPKAAPSPRGTAPKAGLAPPSREPLVDDGEPTVELLPDEPPTSAKPGPRAKKARLKARPTATRPAHHHPAAKQLRPSAS